MRDMASLDVNEIEGSGRLGLDRNLGPLQHDFNCFLGSGPTGDEVL